MPIHETNQQYFRSEKHTISLGIASLFFIILNACTNTQQTGPTVYSSAPSLNYATEFPTQLDVLNRDFSDANISARKGLDKFKKFVGELDNPQWEQVKTIYEKADVAGRSVAVVEWKKRSNYIKEFIESNDGALAQRIGSHVNTQLTKEGQEAKTDFDARPFVRWALKDSTQKQIEKRSEELNEAYRFIDMYRESIGRKNVKRLEKHVELITDTSYFVFIALIDIRIDMELRLGDASEVKNTLDNEIEIQQLTAEDPNSSKKEKKDASRRITELLKIRSQVDTYTNRAHQLIENADEQLELIQKEYQETFDKLIDLVEQKADEQAKG